MLPWLHVRLPGYRIYTTIDMVDGLICSRPSHACSRCCSQCFSVVLGVSQWFSVVLADLMEGTPELSAYVLNICICLQKSQKRVLTVSETYITYFPLLASCNFPFLETGGRTKCSCSLSLEPASSRLNPSLLRPRNPLIIAHILRSIQTLKVPEEIKSTVVWGLCTNTMCRLTVCTHKHSNNTLLKESRNF